MLKEKYTCTPAIGYRVINVFGGLEILDIEYGINDKLITCFNWGKGRESIGRNTIYTSPTGRQYIRKAGSRYYLDEIIKAFPF